MHRLGTVDRTAQGLAIVRVDETPDIGETVIDESLTEVGTVVDVFGPVDQPYAAISVSDRARLPELLGDPLYAR